MDSRNIYADIAKRTDGNIYIGVVGPVRTGKSTFIKRFMESLVLPNIGNEFKRERANDELPQSAAGRTIMTTEPKFVPEEAVEITLDGNVNLRVRMIDCVGYIVPSAIGYIENDNPRMVQTPWFESEIPFNMAAEIGTQKVIREHSTIGLVVTTDGSISEIPRAEYEEAEERVIGELKEINKPFVVLLNCRNPENPETQELRERLEAKHQVPVLAANCLRLEEADIREIIATVLNEFPIKEILVDIPKWIMTLKNDHWLKAAVCDAIKEAASGIRHASDVEQKLNMVCDCEYVNSMAVKGIDMGKGSAKVEVGVAGDLFYKILGEATGLEIKSEAELMPVMIHLANMKKDYDKVKNAIDEVAATGYGIVRPSIEELSLEEPEIVKQNGKFGVRLKASAPSIHMMKANITTEVSPIVGSEKQSEELVMYLLKEFEENPRKIWSSNIFGKSLHELVNEGLNNKLYRMPADARQKLQETIERIINEGCGGLICIIL
ncbi:stage IV sporulation protein A [Acetanaerobacterium elongatum]|uniref:Stage IV sporulation protein A n=1 Tax=Acetanaerobacterium elongatum TaxID=258515 RepID=A0A1G9U0M2_9FIRM|nr:stage IV sporulation protein A [Acetanaerobacterium elongatum]SDM53428.1 stage IV sporulation protein A [Acetanaerobacterium elongatum]